MVKILVRINDMRIEELVSQDIFEDITVTIGGKKELFKLVGKADGMPYYRKKKLKYLYDDDA